MIKKKFIKSTIILLIGGFITKILGMVMKIILTRSITIETLSLYTLIMPTFMLLITISQLGFPVAVSKKVSENKTSSKNIVMASSLISIIVNILLILVVLLLAKPLSSILLQEDKAYYPIIACSLTLPFISISSILRGYFLGKQNTYPQVIANISEQVVRLSIIFFVLPKFLNNSPVYIVCFIILINIIGEIASIIIMMLFIPNKKTIRLNSLNPDLKDGKEILDIALPNTASRLIGNVGYFLEPIILTTALLAGGYSLSYIQIQYGILNGYVLPMLLLPSFFTAAISSSLLPVLSEKYSSNDIKGLYKYLKYAINMSLLIGVPVTILFMYMPEISLNVLYKTTSGYQYLRFLSPFFLLLYIQSNLNCFMQATDNSEVAMKITFKSALIKLVLIFILSSFKIGIYGLVISYAFNILYVTVSQGLFIYRFSTRK